MPFWDRAYGDRGIHARGGGGGSWEGSGWGNTHRGRRPGGGIMGHRQGRMPHDQHRVTGHGGRGHQSPQPHRGGVVGNQGRGQGRSR